MPFGGAGEGTGVYMFGEYPLGFEAAIDADLARLGPFAEGTTDTERVVFAVSPQENRSVLAPLEKFGFVLHAGKFSACESGGARVECPPRGGTTALPTSAYPVPPSGPIPSPAEQRYLADLDQYVHPKVSPPRLVELGKLVCSVRRSGMSSSDAQEAIWQNLKAAGVVSSNAETGTLVHVAVDNLCPEVGYP